MRKDSIIFLKRSISCISKREKISQLYLYVSFAINFIFFGFTPRQFSNLQIYKKKFTEKKKYINYWRAKKIERWFNNSQKKEIFNNKVIFNKIFSKFIKRKWLYMKEINEQQIDCFLKETNETEFVLKPVNLSSGKKIKLITRSEIRNYINSDFLIEEKVVNHPNIAKLSTRSCNTIRVYTLSVNGNLQILAANLRIGDGNSIIDNMHGNGHAVPIDIETGRISNYGKNYFGNIFLTNPCTNESYINMQIPNWEILKKSLYEAIKLVPEITYNGWDIAITTDGIEYIEGNVKSDPNLLQMFLNTGIYDVFLKAKKILVSANMR